MPSGRPEPTLHVSRVVAVDWSGAVDGAEKKIWLAEVEPATREVIRLEAGRKREALARHLIEQSEREPRMVVGFDFAYSLPAWFLRDRGFADAPALWDAVATEGERWLADCAPPFWGRPGVRRPELPEHFRRADREVPAVGGVRPKSVFQIGGAGAVGTGSIRGMPLLATLRRAGFAVWPFDEARFPLVIEIYPRALTGAVVKGDPSARRRYVEECYPNVRGGALDLAAGSEDAFDALVSALVMAEHAAEFSSLPPADDQARRMEGRIWVPADVARAAAPRRERPFDSSKTRVSPVFNQLRRQSGTDPQWVRRLLDLAAPADRTDRPWAAEDLSIRDGDGYWGDREQGLQPPVALLSWLIRNFAPPSGSVPGSDFVATKRRKLLERDSATIEEGLALLRTKGASKGWHVLEGPTFPDVLLVTPDALVVVEGKRTEAGPTVDTTWMTGRHQMLRHLDAAWEIRGRRSVYGLFVVEGSPEGEGTGVPEVWADAARQTTSEEALKSSLPHRGPEERERIAKSFVGVTTWQAICREFRLDPSVLLQRVAGQA